MEYLNTIEIWNAVGRKNRVAVENIVAPDFNPGNKWKQTNHPREMPGRAKIKFRTEWRKY